MRAYVFSVGDRQFSVALASGTCFEVDEIMAALLSIQPCTPEQARSVLVRSFPASEVDSAIANLQQIETEISDAETGSQWTARLQNQSRLNLGQMTREIACLNLEPELSVLDVGSGTGEFSRLLAQKVRTVTGVDQVRSRVAIAQEAAAEAGLANAHYIAADIKDAALEAASFDLAIARLVVQHVPEPAEMVRCISRFVRPGGRIALIDIDEGATVHHPPQPPPLHRLHKAQAAGQAFDGGDRYVGRKLCHYLLSAELRGIGVTSIPMVRYGPSTPEMAAQRIGQFLMHFHLLKDGLVEQRKLLTLDEFQEGIEAGISYLSDTNRLEVSQMFVAGGVVPG